MAEAGARLGVAVSGGADSVCLLHVLRRLGFAPHVLHLNHGLRGAESDADEQFVRALAARLGVPVTVERFRAPGPGVNLEQAGREARYAFFRAAAATLGLDRVATGHTMSDQAETVLFRLMRGSAIEGLAGIRATTREGLIRPLIEIEREAVRDWLRQAGEPWREDASNLDARFARNRIRHELLPLAESIRPGAGAALARLAGLAVEDAAWWDDELARALPHPMPAGPPFVVDARELAARPAALGKRVVARLLAAARGNARGLSSTHIEAVWRLAGQRAGSGAVAVPGVLVRRSLGWLRFAEAGEAVAPWSVELRGPGPVRGAPLRIEVIEETGDGDSRYNESGLMLDAGRVPFPLVLRGWRPGDRFQPVGRAGEVKCKLLLAELGVPCWERRLWPMLVSGDRIAWIRALGPAAWAVAAPDAARWWRILLLDHSSGGKLTPAE
jgi:tRNA(Ile)-lysidine synthase